MAIEARAGTEGQQLRRVRAVRYAMPLREGGSLPALVEGEDLGLYVLKFRGAGQGPLALVAELVCGGVGRALGLAIPELVLMEVDAELGRNEPDAEIRDLLKRSVGRNVGMDFLPGARMFDPAAGDGAEAMEASVLVWFDALMANVDRTARNPNLLVWHKELRPIDHGAAMFWQHDWPRDAASGERVMGSVFAASKGHVLLPWAAAMREADEFGRGRLSEGVFREVLAEVPGAWFGVGEDDGVIAERRAAYAEFLTRRLERSAGFTEEAARARAELG